MAIFSWFKDKFLAPAALVDVTKLSAHDFGRFGEQKAARYIAAQGFKIRARRFCSPVGEIDLIAQRGKQLLFIEVKSRRSDFIAGIQAVNYAKQRRIAAAANYYCAKSRNRDFEPRFDVVCVLVTKGHCKIEHYPGAFSFFY